MIQDIAPHKFDNHYYLDRKPEAQDFVIIYHDRKLLVEVNELTGCVTFPKVSDLKNIQDLIYLFSIDEERFFLDRKVWNEISNKNGKSKFKEADQVLEKEGYSYIEVRKLRSYPGIPQSYVFAAFTAMHLAEWYLRKQYCGKCGQKLIHDMKERAMSCCCCGEKFYPRINPAVIVGVKNGNQLLITRYRQGYKHNALVAGFVEIGETLEETVVREVAEETGLTVRNIQYYKSQPWGVASDLLAGFFCEVDGEGTIQMDQDELSFAEWVSREAIELQSENYSLTNEMMGEFKAGRY